MAALDDLPPLREVIRRHELMARKSLGQNFLLDLNLTAKIARAGGDLAGATIVEVGPGPGGLTRALLAGGAARVVAVERDERCLPALAEIAARLFLSQKTVRNHVHAVLGKIQAADRAEAIIRGRDAGLGR